MVKRKKLVIIDGKSVFYRGYYAMPNLSLPDGTPTGGVYGFAVMALEVLKKMKPDYVAVAWDKSQTNIRSRLKLYDKYKANRKPMPEDMREQIPYLHKLLEAFGWPVYECDDYEADDIMGTLAEQEKADLDSILITSDLDMLQIVNGHTTLAALKKGLTNIEFFDAESFQAKYGITTKQFIDMKALKGDSSDNIPGVKGVGEKTALELIKKYDSLEGVYEHIDDLKGALKTRLETDKDMAYLSRQLVTIFLDAPVKLDRELAAIDNVDPSAIRDILNEYGFKSLLKQIPANWEVKSSGAEQDSRQQSDTSELKVIHSADTMPKPEKIVVHQHSDELWISGDSQTVHTIPIQDAKVIKAYLEAKSIPKIGYDIKATIKSLFGQDIELTPVAHDVRVAAFLINSLIREQSLGSLMGGELDESDPRAVIGAIWDLYDDQTRALDKLPKVKQLAQDIEWPIITVLARMEHAGIKLDCDYLKDMSKELEDQISDIEQEIYGHADEEFNISSPAQLAVVLYQKLKIPTTGQSADGLPGWIIKKTKSGYSTAAPELEKIQSLHPIVGLIFKYREWTKLKSTYVDSLPLLVDKNSKLHTTFALDVAPTGRLSSHDPNLQNIPVRSELGKRIRKAFIATPGNVFISADYSQFELRLAAVLSEEQAMIEAFNSGADIHQLTAAQMYGIEPGEVTKQQRYSAKAVNFGIMYGQGPHALSQQIGISMKQAKEFIDRYFEVRPNLRKYIDHLRDKAKTDGYVETMFGRRRPTPDVHSSNFVVREAAYRAAVNMPLQGTAADLMKLAMIKVQNYFDEKMDGQPKMLVQVHDSILVECAQAQADQVSEALKTIMEGVHPLPIKLDVDVSVGKNWGEL